MLLILLASNSPGMLHPSSAGPVPEPEIIVMFFTQLQVYKASNSTPARITKYQLECLTRLRHTKDFPAFRRGNKESLPAHLCLENRSKSFGLCFRWKEMVWRCSVAGE